MGAGIRLATGPSECGHATNTDESQHSLVTVDYAQSLFRVDGMASNLANAASQGIARRSSSTR